MKRLLLVFAVLVVSSLALNAATAPASSASKCIPNKRVGVEVVNHVAVIVYCGSAKATLKAGGTTTRYKNGECLRLGGDLVVGFGKFTSVSHPVALSNSFYLVIPSPKDGTYRLAVLTVQHKGKTSTIANNVKVVVSGKRTRGTFSGKFKNGTKAAFTGSFTCK